MKKTNNFLTVLGQLSQQVRNKLIFVKPEQIREGLMKPNNIGARLKDIDRHIEKLRGEMIMKYVNGADIRDPQVLILSQQLDEQLNRYDRCKYGPKRGLTAFSEGKGRRTNYA